jgi:FixJ family two-component response regulator
VLLVDDDTAVRAALRFSLELEACKCGATRVDTSCSRMRRSLPGGCLVIDYHTPDLSGSDLLAAPRRRQVGLPAILITGDANRCVRDRAAQAGFREILEKPLDDGSFVHGFARALCGPDESGA